MAHAKRQPAWGAGGAAAVIGEIDAAENIILASTTSITARRVGRVRQPRAGSTFTERSAARAAAKAERLAQRAERRAWLDALCQPPGAYAGRWPLRPQLRPTSRLARHLAAVPAEVKTPAGAAAFFAALKNTVPVFEQVDRITHPLGWGFDYVGSMTLAEADAIGWAGEA